MIELLQEYAAFFALTVYAAMTGLLAGFALGTYLQKENYVTLDKTGRSEPFDA